MGLSLGIGLGLNQQNMPELGPNLAVNGGFDADTDWTKDTGWTIGGGVASHSGADGSIYQTTASVIQGITYRVEVTVTNYVGGTLIPFLRGTHSGLNITSNGEHTVDVVAGADATFVINFFALLSFEADIDNVSVREVL